jgi:hypothetical protein
MRMNNRYKLTSQGSFGPSSFILSFDATCQNFCSERTIPKIEDLNLHRNDYSARIFVDLAMPDSSMIGYLAVSYKKSLGDIVHDLMRKPAMMTCTIIKNRSTKD